MFLNLTHKLDLKSLHNYIYFYISIDILPNAMHFHHLNNPKNMDLNMFDYLNHILLIIHHHIYIFQKFQKHQLNNFYIYHYIIFLYQHTLKNTRFYNSYYLYHILGHIFHGINIFHPYVDKFLF